MAASRSSSGSSKKEEIVHEVKFDFDNWTVPLEIINKRTADPSQAKIEQDLKMLGCDLIQNAGIILKLPQVAMSTAQMLFQRVHYTEDFTVMKEPVDITAMASLFLAAKIEEQPKRSKDIVIAFLIVINQRLKRSFEIREEEYEFIKSKVFTSERKILKNLGFCVRSSYPHKIIVTYYKGLLNALDLDKNVWSVDRIEDIIQRAWNYCNDSLRTDVFVRYPKEAVAVACIHMANEDMHSPFPKSSDNRSWYLLFDVTDEQIKEVCKSIKNLYERALPSYRQFHHYFSLKSSCPLDLTSCETDWRTAVIKLKSSISKY